MMILPFIAVALTLQDTALKEYASPATDIKLSYPSDWSLKREKYSDELRFKVEGKEVYVELMGIEMNFPASHWQDVTREINSNNNRTVLRQWEEELLGVPLLLTKVRDLGKSEIEIAVTGLLLSNRSQKMLFRLHTPESVAPAAEDLWNRVMLTADTISGKLPSEVLPNSGTGTGAGGGGTATVDTTPGRVQVIAPKDGVPGEIVRGASRLDLDKERGTFIYLPAGWQIQGERLTLAGVTLKLGHGIGEERDARKAWLTLCGAALDRLQTVGSRIEPEPVWRKSGFKGSFLERRGSVDGGAEVQWIAYGYAGGYFFTLDWAGTELEFKSSAEARGKLLEQLAIAAE